MPVVSNTSPVLNLAIIGALDLLQRQFLQVLVPTAVLAEFKLETGLPGVGPVQQALKAQWLRVIEPKDNHLIQALSLELD